MVLRYDTRSRVSTYTQTWVSGAEPDFSAFESIATTTLSTSAATVTFSSIPSIYKHLQVRIFTRGNDVDGGYPTSAYPSINSDTTDANYNNHYLNGDGASATSTGSNGNRGNWFVTAGTNGVYTNTQIFTVTILDFLDYADTNTYTTVRAFNGGDFNGAGSIRLASMMWKNTAAITSITFDTDPTYLGNFQQYSSFALYGIKG